MENRTRQRDRDFYPRPPRGGRLRFHLRLAVSSRNFYPRPPRGGRLKTPRMKSMTPLFLSTPSARRATEAHTTRRKSGKSFLSTPSARRATRRPVAARSTHDISIHALREEGDPPVSLYFPT